MKSQVSTKSRLFIATLLLATTGVARAQQEPPGAIDSRETVNPNSQDRLVLEIRKLRIELLEFRIEKHAAAVVALEGARSNLEAERRKLTEDEQNIPQHGANISAQFQSLTPEQQAEFDRVKETLTADLADRLNKARFSLQAREAESSAALETAQQRLNTLMAKLKQMTATE